MKKIILKFKDLQLSAAAAVDARTILTFAVSEHGVPEVWPQEFERKDLACLLEMQAAGKKGGTMKKPSRNVDEQHSSDEDMNDTERLDVNMTDKDDESAVVVGDKLLALLKSEVEEASQLRSYSPSAKCPLCPWRSFPHTKKTVSTDRVRAHIVKYHVASNQYCCSGTKQMKIAVALYDNDVLMGQAPCKLLERSAELLQASVQPGLASSRNEVDKNIRLVLDSSGLKYANATSVVDSTLVRRVGNLLYTQSFAELLWKEVLMCKCNISALVPRLLMHVQNAGSELGSLANAYEFLVANDRRCVLLTRHPTSEADVAFATRTEQRIHVDIVGCYTESLYACNGAVFFQEYSCSSC